MSALNSIPTGSAIFAQLTHSVWAVQPNNGSVSLWHQGNISIMWNSAECNLLYKETFKIEMAKDSLATQVNTT